MQFTDLKSQYAALKTSIDTRIQRVLDHGQYIMGPEVKELESALAAFTGARHCITVASGTEALLIALMALDLQPGDEVITTAHSWIATSETITLAGGRVVFCDTDRETFTLDPSKLEALITPRTRGIVVVHLYGQAADMDAISAIAARHGLWILEDCAQAHLATYKGRRVGTFGRIATFSFYPGKNLGAMGDAGCAVSDDAELAKRMAMFARHGGLSKGEHQIEGINSRMDGLQAAVLCTKMPHLAGWIEGRRRVAARYDKELQGVGDLVLPAVGANRQHTYHLYVIRTARRDDLRRHLNERQIDNVVNYPIALPFLQAYQYLGHSPQDFPVAHEHQRQILSIPIYAELKQEQQFTVISEIKQFFAAG